MLKRLHDEWLQARNLLGFSILQIIGQAAVMAVPLVVAGLFSPDMWGRYSLCEPVIFFFSALLILSAKTPFIIYANQERAQTQSIHKSFSIQCLFFVASILLFVLTVVFFRGPISRLAKIGTAELFYVALAFFAIIIKDFSGNVFMALGRRMSNAVIELAFGILTLSFMFIFYFFGWIDLRSVFLSYFLASLLVLVCSITAIDTKILLPFTFDRGQFREMLNFTLWMMAGTVSGSVINWVGTVMLGHSGQTEAGGTYNLAFKPFKGFMILTYIVAAYFLPYVSENIYKPEKIRAYLFYKRPRVICLGVVCMALAWLIMPGILEILYPGKYNDAGWAVRIFLLGNVFFLYTAMYGPLLGALKIYKFQQFACLGQVGACIILSLILVPEYGVNGAAWATVLSFIFLTIVYELYFNLKIKREYLNENQDRS